MCVCVRERVRWAVEISKCTSSEIGYASILQVYFLAYRYFILGYLFVNYIGNFNNVKINDFQDEQKV